MRTCVAYGKDGLPSPFWLEVEGRNLPERSAEFFLRWRFGGRRALGRVALAQFREARQTGRPVVVGEVRISDERESRFYRLDYEPTRGPDHGLRLWVEREAIASLLAEPDPGSDPKKSRE